MAHDVFVSYSTKDKVVADTIVSALEQNQIRCWYAPRDIQPSEDWGNAITEAIEACRVFLVIFSENANRSQRVLDEVNLAISQQDVILPFRIENLEPKGAMKLHLSSRHWLDAYEPSWETHIKQLVMTVSNNLEKRLAEADVKVAEAQPQKTAGKTTSRNVVIGIAATAVVAVLGWQGFSYFSTEPLPTMTAAPAATATLHPKSLMGTTIAKTATAEIETAVPTQAVTELPSAEDELGEPYYATDFSNSTEDAAVWPIGAIDADGNVYYGTDGTLIIQNFETKLYGGAKKYTDSIVEVDVKILSEPKGIGEVIELGCRNVYSNGVGEYIASFAPNGEVDIIRNQPGYVDHFIGSGKVNTLKKNTFYRLRFDCIGSDFSVYVDGSLIARGSDSAFYSGAIALKTDRDLEVAFDNFKLWLP